MGRKKPLVGIRSTRETRKIEIYFNVNDEAKQSVAVDCGDDDGGAGSGVQESGVLVGGGPRGGC